MEQIRNRSELDQLMKKHGIKDEGGALSLALYYAQQFAGGALKFFSGKREFMVCGASGDGLLTFSADGDLHETVSSLYGSETIGAR